jgi:hypothetical protein
MTLTILQEFLNQNTIPKIKGRPKTFLGIAKQPHYENVLSNIYAFYFNVNEVHKLKDLFIKSLLELINSEEKKLENKDFNFFKDFDITTEYVTENQKRIDILLQNDEQVIIIENKVYHHLNNDLSGYYNEIDAPNKIGIILSLKPISNINHSHYINITHLELLKKVMNNLGNYVLGSSDKYLMFLKDFYQNTINLSLSFMEKENISFYYKNQQKINELVSFKFKLREHIQSEIKNAGERLEDVKVNTPRSKSYNANRLVYFTSLKNENLMLTVVYEELMKENPKFYITIEMWGELLKKRAIYNSIKNTDKDYNEYFCKNFETTEKHWAHFYIREYTPTETEITNLSDFILNKIKTDSFSSILKEIEEVVAS